MNTIKNIHLLELPERELKKLEHGASLHLRMSNIIFKILEVTDEAITIRVTQGKHLSENYADKKRLVEIARDLFQQFFPDKKIHPQAIAYEANPVSEITGQWVKEKMERLNFGVMDIVKATGVDKTNISAWANSTRPMSQPVKAMFYYLFESKGSKSASSISSFHKNLILKNRNYLKLLIGDKEIKDGTIFRSGKRKYRVNFSEAEPHVHNIDLWDYQAEKPLSIIGTIKDNGEVNFSGPLLNIDEIIEKI